MPVAAIGGRHGAAMGAAEKSRSGPTWRGGAAAAGSAGPGTRWSPVRPAPENTTFATFTAFGRPEARKIFGCAVATLHSSPDSLPASGWERW